MNPNRSSPAQERHADKDNRHDSAIVSTGPPTRTQIAPPHQDHSHNGRASQNPPADNTVENYKVRPTRPEERIRQSEALLAHAEELAHIGGWELDVESQTLTWSEHYYRMLGLRPENGPLTVAAGMLMIHPDDRERARRDAEAVREFGDPMDNELRFIRADGSERIFHSRAVAVKDESGRIVRIRGMCQDVTEHRQAESRLLQSEVLLAEAETLADVGSWELDLEAQTVLWSEHYYRMLGLEPQRGPIALGDGLEAIHRDDRERALRDAEAVRELGCPLDNELRFIKADGSERIFHSRAVAVKDVTEHVVRVLGMSQDVTEHRRAELRLEQSEALLAHAEQIANFGSWESDVRTQKVILSENLRRILELTPDAEWSLDHYWQRLAPHERQHARQAREKGIATGQPYEFVVRFIPDSGSPRLHFVKGVPLVGANGKTERTIGVLQDITDQVRTEEELRRLSHQLLRTRDEDRRQMARDLHESAGQSLAALKMTLGRLRQTLPGKKSLAAELLKSAYELAEGAIREVRTVSYLLHPPLLDEAGLGPALRWFAKGFAERSAVDVRVDVPDDMRRPSQEVETTIFRIVQEAMINVHRYSGSSTAWIRLIQQDRQVVAEIHDYGCGLPPAPARGSKTPPGVGIAGMRERVKQLNGVFELESAPGKGTTIRAILPVDAGALGYLTEGSRENAYTGKERRKANQVGS
jgi:PAS domain S-box-containing protein